MKRPVTFAAAFRRAAIVVAPAVVAVGVPDAGWAHGISGVPADKSVWEYLPLGAGHMLLGWDHLLFVAGVVLLAGDLGRAAKLISLFVAGHSVTLIAATLVGWRVNAMLVDAVIAVSVGFVGVVGWIGRPRRWWWFGLAVVGFGLVHGLGLSTRLQDLGLPPEGLLVRVVAFNVGVEIGQLVAIIALVLAGKLVAARLRGANATRVAFGGLIAVGLAAASVLSAQTVVHWDEANRVTTIGACEVRDRPNAYSQSGAYPAKRFYEPGESPPLRDFSYILGDGYLLVYYASTLSAGEVALLRAFTYSGGHIATAARRGQSEPIRALTAVGTLSCDRFDLAALETFSEAWFADPRSRPV